MNSRKPNVLVIIADQFRWDCWSGGGNVDVRTPVLDALADVSTVYKNAFCTAPLCTPSRYSLLTGMLPHEHGGNHNGDSLPLGTETFPAALRSAGYVTATVGKSHFTPTYMDVGYDTMVLAEQDGAGRLRDDYHRQLRDAGLFDAEDVIDQHAEAREHASSDYYSSFGTAASSLPEKWYSTTWITDAAIAEINEWGNGSNLLTVGYIKPHHPFDPPAPWDVMYDPARLSLLKGSTSRVPDTDEPAQGYFDNTTLTEPALRKVMAAYYGIISHLDDQLGRIIEALKRRGIFDDTMIVFTADHGEYLGFHHLLLKHGRMYDPTIRVPLIVHYPRQTVSTKEDVTVSSRNLAATITSTTRAPSSLPGMDLRSITTDEAVISESADRGYTVRTRTLKACIEPGRPAVLYDLVADPLETSDVAAKRPGDLAVLLQTLVQSIGWAQLRKREHGAQMPEIADAPKDDPAEQEAWITNSLPQDHRWLENHGEATVQ